MRCDQTQQAGIMTWVTVLQTVVPSELIDLTLSKYANMCFPWEDQMDTSHEYEEEGMH